MGVENKLLLPLGDKTIVETTIENILAANIGQVIVVVGHESQKLKTLLEKYPLSIIENPDYEQGMTTSIKAGIRAAQENTEGYMICLSDMILIEPNEYQFLAKSFLEALKIDEKAIIQPIFQEKRGNPVIFSTFYKNAILETTDTEGCRSVVQAYKNSVKLVEMTTNHILQDIDFREDYENLLGNKIS
jgi:molybdenum cofactor cytidylyltransferase